MPNNAVKELTQEKSNRDMAHTKVDPYQDPAYNAPLQSPNHAKGTGDSVSQNDSMVGHGHSPVGQGDSMATVLTKPTGNPCIDEDTDLDDDWD